MQATKFKGVAREPQRHDLTGVSTSAWYELQNAGLAPKPIHLGPRTVGWLIEELEEWILARKRERDAGAGWQSLGDAAARVVEKVSGQAG
jgi:prophage regulatory protein